MTKLPCLPSLDCFINHLLDQLSIFANYQNGFTNVAPQLVGNPDDGPQTLKTFDPEQANQLEFGIKTNLFNNRLNATISYYDIKVKDRVITDPSSLLTKYKVGKWKVKVLKLKSTPTPSKV